MAEPSAVGDIVWYTLGNERDQARIVDISGSTHATVMILTGSAAGQEIDAPWGIIEPLHNAD